MTVYADDRDKEYKNIVLERLGLVLANGESSILVSDSPHTIAFEPWGNSLYAKFSWPDAVDGEQDFTVKARGYFELENGETLPLNGECQFEKTLQFPILPGLKVWCGI